MRNRGKLPKILALVGCCLVGAGLLLGGAGFVAMGCNLDPFIYAPGPRDPAREVASFPGDGTVAALEIDASLGDVAVTGVPQGEEITVAYCPSACTVSVEDGVLTLRDRNDHEQGRKWYQVLQFSRDEGTDVAVTLPQGLLDSLSVESGMGQVALENVEAGEVTVTASAGDVELENVSAGGALAVSQSLGNISLTDCSGAALAVANDMGEVTVAGGRFEQGAVTGGFGDVEVSGAWFGALQVAGDVGDCALDHVAVEGEVSCTAGMGSVEVQALQSPRITLATDTGDVSGTIQGRQADYQIHVEADLGDSNLQNQAGPGERTLQVTTGMGAVALEFTGE